MGQLIGTSQCQKSTLYIDNPAQICEQEKLEEKMRQIILSGILAATLLGLQSCGAVLLPIKQLSPSDSGFDMALLATADKSAPDNKFDQLLLN